MVDTLALSGSRVFSPWLSVSQTLSPPLAKFPQFPPLLCTSFHGRRLPLVLLSTSRPLRSSHVPHASASPSVSSSSSEADLISPVTIFTADGSPVEFQQLWDQTNGTAVVAFLRHFGCPLCWEFAASLRDAKPKFDAAGVKLVAIGVGTPDKARILAAKLPFPKDSLYADPDRKAYDALGLYYGVGRTFFNPASAKVFSRGDKIWKALKGYTRDATPEDRSSVLQQVSGRA